MRKLLLGLLISLTIGCATLKNSNGTINVAVLLTDAQFSITAACYEQWLSPDICNLATDAITLSQSIVAKDPTTTRPAIKKILQDTLNKLPSNNRLAPYLNWLIVILGN
jgi:hypothetical protein